ncbi:MAG: type III pantothenate kinase [Xanthomonadales bacterium]|nr:type III pantothenate kinase [Xanthomonadales bacterium]
MAEWTLLLDVGNSRVKWAWVRDRELSEEHTGSLPHDRLGSLETLEGPAEPSQVLLASVANESLTGAVVAHIEERWSLTPQRLRTGTRCGDVVNGYGKPETLGVDRWLALLGGRRRHGLPLVVMDVGSATTVDALDERGRHLGGWLLPGPAMMRDAVRRGTALAELSEADAQTGPAQDTLTGLASGILAAQAGALQRFLAGLPASMQAAKVVICGGGAAAVRGAILAVPQHDQPGPIEADPWLVFEGMLMVMEDEHPEVTR